MRSRKELRTTVYAGAFVTGMMMCAAPVAAQEFGKYTPYYEDDALLDITEWFDGNDYNPTDEAWWRWDDETYDAWADASDDTDNDWYYGYDGVNDNDWFYDYYDPWVFSWYDADRDNTYDYGYRSYDYDNDGIADGYASYSDWDGDGLYEDYDYYSFSGSSTDEQKKRSDGELRGQRDSRMQTLTGKIEEMKRVDVRGGKEHTVVRLEAKDAKGDAVVADLGPSDKLGSTEIKTGQTITVKGPRAQVGKQPIVLATSVDINGKSVQVDRTTRSITGKVLDTHTATIRGKDHQMAMLEVTRDGKTRKIAVDLGRADRLDVDVTEGSTLTLTGFPVKAKDRTLILAQTVRKDGRSVQINRQPMQSTVTDATRSKDRE